MIRRHALRAAALLLAASLSLHVPDGPGLAAQQSGGTLAGRVMDSEMGEGILGATIRIKGVTALFTSDSTGRFVAAGLPLGEVEVTVAALGYAGLKVKLFLQSEAQPAERSFSMEFTGDKLPDVVVRARAERLAPRYVDFERRRERGLGAYYRWDELLARGFNTVGDALRTIRGVRIECNQQRFECVAHMSRAPNCEPTWWIDGVAARSFTESTSIRDLYGLEVYRGAGEIPGEFAGSNAACGVIALWTKSRPYR
ncbi:MAG: carboxypeptidase-like regulatory domain-containing protein [Gemmatimonadota bacterium]